MISILSRIVYDFDNCQMSQTKSFHIAIHLGLLSPASKTNLAYALAAYIYRYPELSRKSTLRNIPGKPRPFSSANTQVIIISLLDVLVHNTLTLSRLRLDKYRANKHARTQTRTFLNLLYSNYSIFKKHIIKPFSRFLFVCHPPPPPHLWTRSYGPVYLELYEWHIDIIIMSIAKNLSPTNYASTIDRAPNRLLMKTIIYLDNTHPMIYEKMRIFHHYLFQHIQIRNQETGIPTRVMPTKHKCTF